MSTEDKVKAIIKGAIAKDKAVKDFWIKHKNSKLADKVAKLFESDLDKV